MRKSKTQDKSANRVFFYLSILAAVLLVTFGGLAYWVNTFTTNMVRTELAAQKIYFPEKGTPALDPATYPDLQQYAGQLVDTPEEARAYANGYIGRHLKKSGGGKTYSEISAEAAKDPSNQKLQQQKQSLFQGETLRGILLTSGYGFGTVGKIAGIASYILFALGGAMVLAAAFFRTKL